MTWLIPIALITGHQPHSEGVAKMVQIIEQSPFAWPLDPVLVRHCDDGTFMIVNGHAELEAYRLVGNGYVKAQLTL